MMKTLLFISIISITLLGKVDAAENIKVMVDGKRVDFANAKPMLSNEKVYVPLRGVFEQMGARVNWVPEQRTILISSKGKSVTMTVGSNIITTNGETRTLDDAPMLRNGSVMIPLRFVSETLGANVVWKDDTKTVAIDTSGASLTGTAGNIGVDDDDDTNDNRDIFDDNHVGDNRP